MQAAITTFCDQFLFVTPSTPLLTPGMTIPPNGCLIYQDVTNMEYGKFVIDEMDYPLVAADIFQVVADGSTGKKYTANVKYRNQEENETYITLENKFLYEIVDFIAMCSGNGVWCCHCGHLLAMLTGLDGVHFDTLGYCNRLWQKWDPKGTKRLSDHVLSQNKFNIVLVRMIRMYCRITHKNAICVETKRINKQKQWLMELWKKNSF
jgi:large-conductance mechanosensitive channel